VSAFARAVGRGLNADWPECRPLKTAVCGRNADPSHTAITITWQCDMVVNTVGRHSDRLAFRQSNAQDRNY